MKYAGKNCTSEVLYSKGYIMHSHNASNRALVAVKIDLLLLLDDKGGQDSDNQDSDNDDDCSSQGR